MKRLQRGKWEMGRRKVSNDEGKEMKNDGRIGEAKERHEKEGERHGRKQMCEKQRRGDRMEKKKWTIEDWGVMERGKETGWGDGKGWEPTMRWSQASPPAPLHNIASLHTRWQLVRVMWGGCVGVFWGCESRQFLYYMLLY